MSNVLTPKKSSLNLMQNCDLPPPVKLYSGPNGVFVSSISKIYGIEAEEDKAWWGNEKLEILKALQLSQTRAREAERKLRVLSEEKNVVSKLLVDESMRLFAYRQWFHLLLEFRALKLQRLSQDDDDDDHDDDEGRSGRKKWCVAIALCLAITFAFGCTYVF